jgi:protein-L-isoaspartate(D-aspartate) O-methyltransferase
MSLGIRNVRYRFADGTLGWPAVGEPGGVEPFDRILIAAGAPELPRELLLKQLRHGGKAVMPVGPQDEQMLVTVTRNGSTLSSEPVCPVRFVRLIGREGWPDDDVRR